MMTAGPWRLDALEILTVTQHAAFDKRHLIESIVELVDTGRVGERELDPALRAKLRQVRAAIDELNPLVYREDRMALNGRGRCHAPGTSLRAGSSRRSRPR